MGTRVMRSAGQGLVALALLAGGCRRGEAVSEAAKPEPVAGQPAAAGAPAPESGQPAAEAEPGQSAAVAQQVEVEPPAPARAGTCPKSADTGVGILASPERAVAGEPLRIVAATLDGEAPLSLRVEGPGGEPLAAELTYRPGVPSATIATVAAPPAGKVTVVVGREGEGLACETVRVAKTGGARTVRPATEAGVWPVDRAWDPAEEALFSAWVRELFWAPRGEELAWAALHEVTSDRARNLLYDHYGWSEDDADLRQGLYLKPDCADAPYFLRAYFAWKRGLPFGFRRCSRGHDKAPHCGELRGVVGPPEDSPDARKPGELGAVQRYFRRTVAWGVHSGNGRPAHDDDESDFYPVELARRALRPGIIYADPYGHLFVVVEMVSPQGDDPGILYAIDGQPDGSITRKRFWEGNFLWNPDPKLGGSGFKAFRPHDVVEGRVVAATNREIASRPGYGDFSLAQGELSAPEFYDRMDALVTPGRRDPIRALREAVAALHESAKVRVTSVQNAEDYLAGGGATVEMPQGHAIFETTGAWENYSTPARDLRLLIAIDVVQGFEAKVARNPAVFLREGQTLDELRAELATARADLIEDEALRFHYERSDGSQWTLGVADVIERAGAFEMAYNPNDCPELRWGAPSGSDERSTCRRRAPADQRRKMEAYRPWFADRRRPARGDPGPPVE